MFKIKYYTSFSDIMSYVNEIDEINEKVERIKECIKQLPSLNEIIKIYFGDEKNLKYKNYGEALTLIDSNKIKIAVMDRRNFSFLYNNIGNTYLRPPEVIKSLLLAEFEYMNESDITFIFDLFQLNPIDELNEFGIEAYYKLIGK